jgi:hypothetical protein
MVDALARNSDEGRGVAAISFGESLADFDPEISEWGNPLCLQSISMLVIEELTRGSKTFQYPEENKTKVIP